MRYRPVTATSRRSGSDLGQHPARHQPGSVRPATGVVYATSPARAARFQGLRSSHHRQRPREPRSGIHRIGQRGTRQLREGTSKRRPNTTSTESRPTNSAMRTAHPRCRECRDRVPRPNCGQQANSEPIVRAYRRPHRTHMGPVLTGASARATAAPCAAVHARARPLSKNYWQVRTLCTSFGRLSPA